MRVNPLQRPVALALGAAGTVYIAATEPERLGLVVVIAAAASLAVRAAVEQLTACIKRAEDRSAARQGCQLDLTNAQRADLAKLAQVLKCIQGLTVEQINMLATVLAEPKSTDSRAVSIDSGPHKPYRGGGPGFN